MEIRAKIKYVRISPKKIKTLARAVIGFSPQEAMERLAFSEKKGGFILGKAIKSALSNAVNNLKIEGEKLRIKRILIGKGPILKRWLPVSRGMAHQIKKRTTHLQVILEEKEEEKKPVQKKIRKKEKK